MKKDKNKETIESTETTESPRQTIQEPEIMGFLEPQVPLVPLEPEMSIEHMEPVAPPYIPEPHEPQNDNLESSLIPSEQFVLSEHQLIPPGQQQKSLELWESPKVVMISTPTNQTTLFEVMARKQRKELKSIEL